jgi:hypothetical protein
MWLIYGHTERRKRRGIVADECPLCEDVRPFLVTEHYVVSHLYFIPLGRGRLQASVRRCQACQGAFACDSTLYDQFLSVRQARTLPIDELLEQTNPNLARAREARLQLEREAQRAVAGQSHADDEVLLRWLMTRLRQLGEALVNRTHYQDRLLSWYQLPATERERLRREIEAFIEDRKKLQRAAIFTDVVSRTFPRAPGCLPALFLWMALMIVAFFLAALLRLEGSIVLFLLIGLVAIFLCYRSWARSSYQRWFCKKFIPSMEAHAIDLPALLTVLSSIKKSPPKHDPWMRALVKRSDLLVEILRGQDHPPPELDAHLQAEGQS